MLKSLACYGLMLGLISASAAELTLQRIETLPATQREAWVRYWQRSQENARKDAAALQAELTETQRTRAIKPPSGKDFRLPAKPGDAWYESEEAELLADAILSYQTPSGGWSKHNHYASGPRQPGTQWTSQNDPGESPHYLGTFDNKATVEELYFLAAVWQATQRDDCREAFVEGLNYILAAQYPNGGWPQVYPLEGDYHDNITFNDDAMTRVLELLQAVVNQEENYDFLSKAQRRQAAAALERGRDCVLKTQVIQKGVRTVWCAQYDALTLTPAGARKMEPATLSGLESSRVLDLLMSTTNPSDEMIAAIEAALDWFEATKVTGLTRTKRDGRTAYEKDPESTKVYWARFYDLENNQPVFPGRDGVIYKTFEAMAGENRLGYDFYTTLPGSIVNNGQKKWRKILAKGAKN